MRIYSALLLAAPCVVSAAVLAWAHSPKGGLYEVTSQMTWQQSPFPAGMQAPAGAGGPHSTQVCVTQTQIEKYNGPKPDASGGCHVTNIQKHEGGMTAEIVCDSQMKGKGTIETTWTDSGHSKSKVHFTGSMQMVPNSKKIEWTVESISTYKGPACGAVKPLAD